MISETVWKSLDPRKGMVAKNICVESVIICASLRKAETHRIIKAAERINVDFRRRRCFAAVSFHRSVVIPFLVAVASARGRAASGAHAK